MLAYGTFGVTLTVLFGLEPFASPCTNLIDGPCEQNWASDAQWMVLPLFLLAMAGSLCLTLWDLWSAGRRRWRRYSR